MLNKEQIERLIRGGGLIEGCIHLKTQLTPNGFDLTAGQIFSFVSAGRLDFSNKQRALSDTQEVVPRKAQCGDKFGWWELPPGAYKVRTNETICLPLDLTALSFSRSSLLRMGAWTQHGVWDAGFKGKGEFVLVVGNPRGIKIKQNARVAQLVFFPTQETQGYRGIYQEG
ncbi:MAG: deoxyuridine 5'-triphosphate nucleotidohydrolase [Candidatus Omnitrophota bacterium]